MAIVITVATQKGGSCKTTTAVNLACALASAPYSKRVLVVDVDPQANAGISLGLEHPNSQPVTVSALFDNASKATFSQVIVPSKFEGVDLVPSNIDLFAIGNKLAYGNPAAVLGLKSKLDAATMEKYDFIIIDTPPNLGGPFVINAMIITDYFIIPVECGSSYALMGMEQLLDSINDVRGCTDRRLELLGVLLTRYEGRTTASRAVEEMVTERFGDLVFKTRIRKATSIEQANVATLPLLLFNRRSSGAEDYERLAEEVLERTGRAS